MPNIIAELKKRKVFNSAAIYLATAFILLQAAQILIPALKIPEWTISFLVVLSILGFPVVIIISWIYDIGDEGFVKTESESETPSGGMSKVSTVGIIGTLIITIFMIYKGVDYFTTSKEMVGKTSLAVLNFDNTRKFKEYEWLGEHIANNLSYKLDGIGEVQIINRLQIGKALGEIDPEKASIVEYRINQIAKNIDVDLILHGNYTIMDSIIEVLAFFADINTGKQIALMLEQYPIQELSDIPSNINDIVSAFIKTDSRFKPEQND